MSKHYKFDEGAMSETTKRSARYFPNQMNTVMSDLSLEIISQILSLLPIECILTCRAVCAAWNRLTKEPYFVDLQSKAQTHHRTILIRNSNCIYLLDAVRGKTREISLTTINTGWKGCDFSVMSSCRGFLCLVSGLEDVLVCNPITLEHVVLPKVTLHRHWRLKSYDHVALGYDHSSDKYKVVKMYLDKISGLTNVLILTLGENTWRALDPTCRVVPSETEFPRYCGDAIYWMIDQRFHKQDDEYILVLNLSDEKFQAIAFSKCIRKPKYRPGYEGVNNHHLLNGTNNTLFFIEEECWTMHLWTLKKERDEVLCRNYFLLDFHARWSVFSQPVLIETMGPYHLLEVSKFGIDGESDLVLYCSKSKQFISPPFRGLPERFRSFSFQPNFVAPPIAGVPVV